MYLRRYEPQKPVACDHCGHPSPNENEWQCSGCQRLFWGRYRLNPEPPKNEHDWKILTYRHDALGPDSFPKGIFQDQMASANLPLRMKFDVEPVTLEWGDKTHVVPKLYRIWRAPAGMFGCWVVFRWGGEGHVPDLSIPIDVEELPKDAKPLTDEEAITYWSH